MRLRKATENNFRSDKQSKRNIQKSSPEDSAKLLEELHIACQPFQNFILLPYFSLGMETKSSETSERNKWSRNKYRCRWIRYFRM